MRDLSSKKIFPLSSRHHPLTSFTSELNKIMRNFQNWLEPFNFPSEQFEDLTVTPAVDIIDENDYFKVEIEMPGMGEEDVEVSITDSLLIVKGEKTTSKKDKSKNYMLREISYGAYERRIPLPDSVDIDKAKASFKKSMLWVDIPKKPESIKEPRILELEKASE